MVLHLTTGCLSGSAALEIRACTRLACAGSQIVHSSFICQWSVTACGIADVQETQENPNRHRYHESIPIVIGSAAPEKDSKVALE